MVVLTIGSFDLLHDGHRALLRSCAKLGQVHVGVNSDRFYTEYRGYPAVQTETMRMLAVATEIGSYVDQSGARSRVHLNDGPGRDLILELRPDVLAIGPDWLDRDYLLQIHVDEAELFDACVALAFVGPARQAGLSSSALRERPA